jgi:hypothetical protein
MIEIRHAIGETVRLVFSVVVAGAGVSGATPTATIRRQSDGRWFDGSIAAPADPFTSTYATNAMVALDPANLPGVYVYDFPQYRDTVLSDYEVSMLSVAPPAVDVVVLRMGPLVSASLAECTIFGTIVDGGGRPIANSLVRATPIPVSTPGMGQGVAMTPPILATTNAAGYFEMTLVQGINIRLEIQDIGYDNQVLVPSSTSVPFTILM